MNNKDPQTHDWEHFTREGLRAHAQKHFENAEKLLLQALQLAEHFGFQDPRLSTTLIYYATNLLANNQLPQAEDILRGTLQQLAILETRGPDLQLNRATCHNNLGLIAKHRENYKAAESSYRDALFILEKQVPPGHPLLSATKANLATVYLLAGESHSAELLLIETLEDEEQHNPDSVTQLPSAAHRLATALIHQGKQQRAEALYQRFFQSWQTHGKPNNSVVTAFLEDYKELLQDQGRLTEATNIQIFIDKDQSKDP